MKRIFSNIMLVAAAAMAFFSCQKQEIAAPEVSGEVMLSFVSEKPEFSDATKTEWTGETVQWSKGDKIAVAYTVNGNWQNANGDANADAKLYKSDELEQASGIAKFNVSTYFKGNTEGVHVFYGVYPAPSETSFPNAPVASVSVSPSQSPKADSFDANGDLLVGVSNECASRPGDGEKLSLLWERIVAHAVVTLKEIKGIAADEKLEKIVLTAQADANLVGKQKLNLITKEVECDNAEANVLNVSAGNLTHQNGTVTFWACVLPETITSLTVEVETDKATYTRTIAGISKEFKQNARNLLTINMDSADRVEKVADATVVVDVLTRATTGISGTSYASWSDKTVTSAAVYAGQSAGGNESIQLRSNNSNSGLITTASGGYVKKVTVSWQSSTSSGRTLNVYGKSSPYTNPTDLYDSSKSGDLLGTIVCGTSTELVIDGEYEYIGMRSASGAMYLEEIKITWSAGETETPEDYLTVSETEIDVNADATSASFTVSSNLEWTATSDDAEVTVDGSTVNVSFESNDSEEAKVYTVTVSAAGVESAIVKINQAGKIDVSDLPVGIKAIYSAIKSVTSETPDAFEVALTDAVVTYVNGNSAFVEDETAGILIYKSSHGLLAGDKLNGVLTGKGYIRYGVCQITEFDLTNITKETGADIPVVEITVADLLNDYDSYVSRRIKIVDATVTDGVAGTSDKNGAVKQNGSAVNLYNNNSTVNFVETEVVDFYAYPSYYSTTKQLATWESPTTKKVATPVITCNANVVTISCGTSGASVYYAIGNGEFVAYPSAGIAIDATVTVKAYATKSGLTTSETASFECEYVDLGSQPETVDASLSFANKAQRTSQTTSQQTWEQNGIKLVNDKASSSSNVADYANPARFYKDSKLTISAPGNITKIEFTCNSSSYATALKNSIASGGTVTVSGSKVTVVLSAPATSFVVDKLTGGQVRMNSLTVTYEK